jgi:hypothetical protein
MKTGRGAVLLAVVVAGSLLTANPSASADEVPWTDGAFDSGGRIGNVEIRDHRDVVVCDLRTDDLRVGVEYTTTIGRTIIVQAGPRKGCTTHTVWLGRIQTAMFCYGYDVDPDGGSFRWCKERTRV